MASDRDPFTHLRRSDFPAQSTDINMPIAVLPDYTYASTPETTEELDWADRKCFLVHLESSC